MNARLGALVVHGLTSTPQSVSGLGRAFAAAGFEVATPLLPGHGTTPEDLAGCGWDDWAAVVETAFCDLAERGGGPEHVAVAGLSMGGALAVATAAAHPEVGAVVAVNPQIDPPAPSFRQLLGELLAQGHPFLPAIGGDLADPEASEDAYDRLPVAALLSLCHGLDDLLARLGRVASPVLIATSRHDHVVPTVSSDVLAGAVSGPVERLWLERSHHVATLDLERDQLERRAVAFALRHLS